jgi:hypothetical protein
MTRIDPNPMNADELREGVAQGRHLPEGSPQRRRQVSEMTPAQMEVLAQHLDGASVVDLYTAGYEQGFLRQGVPAAEARDRAKYWAKLKANPPKGWTVVDPDLSVDEIMAQYRAEKIARGESLADPNAITAAAPGIRVAAAGLPAGGPPPIMEVSRSRWLGTAQPVNRFSLNPGHLPVVTGSGIDPATLRWIAWPLRQSAAFSSSRSEVAQLVELSLGGDPESWESQNLASEMGRAALEDYWGRVATWVSTPAAEGEMTEEEYRRFYPDPDDD